MTQVGDRRGDSSLQPRGAGVWADRVFSGASLAAGLLVLAILALILVTTLVQAWPAFTYQGVSFITSGVWIPNDPDGEGPARAQFGTLAFTFGTLVVSLIALVIAVPISFGIALFLTEFAPARIRAAVVTVIDLLAATPSVVFGLWGILVVAPALVPVYRGINHAVAGVPVLGSVFGAPVSTGRNFMTAGLILAIMIVPIIASVTREVFATVPRSDKDAALALGATHWEMITGAVFPHSFGGMVGAVILGLGRAMGETIAVSLTIGAAVQITPNLFAGGNALPAIIVQNFGDPGSFPGREALIGCGVVLFVMTVIVNYAARLIVRRAEIRMKGAAA